MKQFKAVLMCHIIDISTLSKISVSTLAPRSHHIDVVYITMMSIYCHQCHRNNIAKLSIHSQWCLNKCHNINMSIVSECQCYVINIVFIVARFGDNTLPALVTTLTPWPCEPDTVWHHTYEITGPMTCDIRHFVNQWHQLNRISDALTVTLTHWHSDTL